MASFIEFVELDVAVVESFFDPDSFGFVLEEDNFELFSGGQEGTIISQFDFSLQFGVIYSPVYAVYERNHELFLPYFWVWVGWTVFTQIFIYPNFHDPLPVYEY